MASKAATIKKVCSDTVFYVHISYLPSTKCELINEIMKEIDYILTKPVQDKSK